VDDPSGVIVALLGLAIGGVIGDAQGDRLKWRLRGAGRATEGFVTATLSSRVGAPTLSAGPLSGWLPDPATDPRVLLVGGIGGLMIVGLGLGPLELVRVRVAGMPPALALVVPLGWALGRLL